MRSIMKALSLDDVHIDELLCHMTTARWSELHVEVDYPPYGRPRGAYTLAELKQYEAVRPHTAQQLLYDILTDQQIARLEKEGAVTFFYLTADEDAIFSAHVLHHQGRVEATFHAVPRRS